MWPPKTWKPKSGIDLKSHMGLIGENKWAQIFQVGPRAGSANQRTSQRPLLVCTTSLRHHSSYPELKKLCGPSTVSSTPKKSMQALTDSYSPRPRAPDRLPGVYRSALDISEVPAWSISRHSSASRRRGMADDDGWRWRQAWRGLGWERERGRGHQLTTRLARAFLLTSRSPTPSSTSVRHLRSMLIVC